MQFTLFCRDLRCFVVKCVLSWFTHFCVEKNWTKNCICGEKMTNMRYDSSSMLFTILKFPVDLMYGQRYLILDDLSFGISMLFTILTWCMFSGIFASLPCQIVCQCADNVLFAQYVVKVCLKFPSIKLQESAWSFERQT